MGRDSENRKWISSKKERTCDEYVADRIEFKINRYDQKKDRYRNLYWLLAIIAALGSLLVPMLINVGNSSIAATIVSLIVGFAVALQGILHPREIWRNYYLLSAILREEEMLFSRRAGPYRPDELDGEDPCVRLVERVENAIAAEREETIQIKTSPYDQRSRPGEGSGLER